MNKEIKNFGVHIGGSVKDRRGGSTIPSKKDSLNKDCSKDVLWKRPDYEALYKTGADPVVLWWKNNLRNGLETLAPDVLYPVWKKEEYVDVVKYVMKTSDTVVDFDSMDAYYRTYIRPKFLTQLGGRKVKVADNASLAIGNKFLRAAQVYHDEAVCKEKKSPVVKERKPESSVKKEFKSVCVKDMKRTGHDYVKDLNSDLELKLVDGQYTFADPDEVHANGQDFMDIFGFRGGEFGEWLSQKDRQEVLNAAFNALMDLSELLSVEPSDLSMGGKLAIAFGARGHGKAAAHFEPKRVVINLTKMNGKGKFWHEVCHALDWFLAYLAGYSGLASESHCDKDLNELLDILKYDEYGHYTKYYIYSRKFDELYRKAGHGYWSSDCELFARAGDCWLHDTMKERHMRSDFLSCNSEDFHIGNIWAIPKGEERKRINKAFDRFFRRLKKRGVLHEKYAVYAN